MNKNFNLPSYQIAIGQRFCERYRNFDIRFRDIYNFLHLPFLVFFRREGILFELPLFKWQDCKPTCASEYEFILKFQEALKMSEYQVNEIEKFYASLDNKDEEKN